MCAGSIWVCVFVEQSESIKLDPALMSACTDDVAKLCPTVHPGGGAVSFSQKWRQHVFVHIESVEKSILIPSSRHRMYKCGDYKLGKN